MTLRIESDCSLSSTHKIVFFGRMLLNCLRGDFFLGSRNGESESHPRIANQVCKVTFLQTILPRVEEIAENCFTSAPGAETACGVAFRRCTRSCAREQRLSALGVSFS